MSDSDDDYMSDKLLQGVVEDVRPGLIHSRSKAREHQQYKERITAKPTPTAKEVEAQKRDQGLNTALSASNKGFQLLQKMGYKAGSSLGRPQQSGIVEPIAISVKADAGGLGRQRYVQERQAAKMRQKRDAEHSNFENFRRTHTERNVEKQLWRSFSKAQSACQDLDMREGKAEPDEPYYWKRNTMLAIQAKKRRMMAKASSEDDEECATVVTDNNDDDEQVDSSEEEEAYDRLITPENLDLLIYYLRSRYRYCIFCAFTASSAEELSEQCPGPSAEDHDDYE